MLYLIPTSLADDYVEILPARDLEIVRKMNEFIVENEKTARQFLKKIGVLLPQSELTFHLLNEHSDSHAIGELLRVILKDKPIGLMSDAGCPAIADPGSELVKLAHQHKIKVKPLIGPSSIILSLMSSGFSGQSFVFHGYLPKEQNPRKARIRELEKAVMSRGQSQIFIETPYRNNQMLGDLLNTLSNECYLSISCDLTSDSEYIRSMTIGEWKIQQPDLNKRPAIFIIGK